jgi:hypothetical protein
MFAFKKSIRIGGLVQLITSSPSLLCVANNTMLMTFGIASTQDSIVSINDLKKVVNINKEKLGITSETKKLKEEKEKDVRIILFSCS